MDRGSFNRGYWAIRLCLSSVLPMVLFRNILMVYILLVAAIFIPTHLINGWPASERWSEVLYPFIGTAVVRGVYSLIAWVGKRRIEKISVQ